MKTLTTITIMRIIGANPEVVDPIDKIQDVPLEAKISVAEVKEIRTHTKANIKMMAIKAIITRVIKDFIIIHIGISLKVGRSRSQGRGNYHGHGRSRPNYRGNANYQYHQYYGHDDEYQTILYDTCILLSHIYEKNNQDSTSGTPSQPLLY